MNDFSSWPITMHYTFVASLAVVKSAAGSLYGSKGSVDNLPEKSVVETRPLVKSLAETRPDVKSFADTRPLLRSFVLTLPLLKSVLDGLLNVDGI